MTDATTDGWAERARRHGLLLVLLLSVVVFLPTLGSDFPMDDEFVAKAHDHVGKPRPMVAELQPIGEYFRSHWWQDYYEGSELYRPVTKLSIALVYNVFGKQLGSEREALPQHLVNLLVHVWATFLVFQLLRLVLASRGAALAGALVFGVHALHTEAVAEIVGRCDLLAFCFGAQGLVLVMGANAAPARGLARTWRLLLASLLFFGGFCSKEIALAWVAFVPLFVLAAWLARRREAEEAYPLPSVLWSLLAVLPAAALFLWLRQRMIVAQGDAPAIAWAANPLAHAPALERILTAIKVEGFALLKVLFPHRLAVEHGPAVFATVRGPGDPWFLLALLALGGSLVGGLLAARRHPLLFVAMVSFLGFAFIVSNVPFAIGTVFAERLYYGASVGLAFLVAWLFGVAERRGHLAGAVLALGLWVTYNSVYSFQRSLAFTDTYSIAVNDVEAQPRSAHLQRLVGEARKSRGDLLAARLHFEKAVELDPGFAASWLELGAIHLRLGSPARAVQTYRSGLRHGREEMRIERGALHANLGFLLARNKKLEEAVEHFRAALAIDPGETTVQGYLRDALREMERR